jgi:hypothetical protein
MFNHIEVLNKLKIPTTCGTSVVVEIGDRVREASDQIGEAIKMITAITGGECPQFTDKHRARLTAQYLGAMLFKHGELFKPTQALEAAIVKANKYRDNPDNKQWFNDMTPGSSTYSETKSVAGVDVEVKASGKLKKGGNAVVAMQLYVDNVVSKAMSNKDFITLLITTLSMSKAGATTYLYSTAKKYKEQVKCR